MSNFIYPRHITAVDNVTSLLADYNLCIVDDVPKMQLSEDCPVTPEFRKSMNAWMREFFGVDCVVPDDMLFIERETEIIYVNLRTALKLRKMLDIELGRLEFPHKNVHAIAS